MKLIGLDLDGSLLKDDQTVSDNSVSILNEISNNGHKIVLTSGRSKNGIIRYYNKLNLDTPIISLSGALISFPDGTFIEHNLNGNDINNLYLDNLNILESLMLNSRLGVYSYKHNYETEVIFNGAKSEEIFDFNHNDDNNHFLGGVAIVKDLNKEIFEDYFKNSSLNARYWGSYNGYAFYDIHSKKVSKAKSLKKVLEYYNLTKDNFIAIGDGVNDLEMITEASVGVAMKNGLETIKKAADKITAFSNQDDGVALFLKDYLL